MIYYALMSIVRTKPTTDEIEADALRALMKSIAIKNEDAAHDALLKNEERFIERCVMDFKLGLPFGVKKCKQLMEDYGVSRYDFERVRPVLEDRLSSISAAEISDPCFWIQSALECSDVQLSASARDELRETLSIKDDVVRIQMAGVVYSKYHLERLRAAYAREAGEKALAEAKAEARDDEMRRRNERASNIAICLVLLLLIAMVVCAILSR